MKLKLEQPPYIWPDTLILAGLARYESAPPFHQLLSMADLISGVLIDVADETVQWLEDLMLQEVDRNVALVILVYPACPTRKKHLTDLVQLQEKWSTDKKKIKIHMLPVSRLYGEDCEKMAFPPTLLQAHDTAAGKTIFCIGSIGNAGKDALLSTSFNLVFQPDDALRNAWRVWFQYLFSCSVLLTSETIHIPHLIPATGDIAADQLWKSFKDECFCPHSEQIAPPVVDPETGEVTHEADGKEVEPWDGGKTALDSIALIFQKLYGNGFLVTVDEATRIKPLSVPVKATLLGQRSARTVGALTQRQSFNLEVLDSSIGKEVEKCRKVSDLMDLLCYQLSQGNRFIPESAKSLLERELDVRNIKGLEVLKAALGGLDVSKFIEKRRDNIRKDLDGMYKELTQGITVPEDKFKIILEDIQSRLKNALNTRITPRAVYNRIGPPDLTADAPEENWCQSLALMLGSARLFRKVLVDRYFPARFKSMSFSDKDFIVAMDVFGDEIVKNPNNRQASDDLLKLTEIEKQENNAKEKCVAVWRIIKGNKQL